MAVLQDFSPATVDDDAAISPWLDIFEMSAARRLLAGRLRSTSPPTAVARYGLLRFRAG